MTTTSTLTDSSHETAGGPTTLTQPETVTLGLQRHRRVRHAHQHSLVQRHRQLQPLRDGQRDVFIVRRRRPGGRPLLASKTGLLGHRVADRDHDRDQHLHVDADRHDDPGLGRHDHRRHGRRFPLRNRQRQHEHQRHRHQRPPVRFSNAASDYSTFHDHVFLGQRQRQGTFTQTESDTPSFSTNGVITSGPDIETLTPNSDTTTQTYSENGSRTVSWGTGNNEIGRLVIPRPRPPRYPTEYDSTSLALGTKRHDRQRHGRLQHDRQLFEQQPVGPGERQRGRHRPGRRPALAVPVSTSRVFHQRCRIASKTGRPDLRRRRRRSPAAATRSPLSRATPTRIHSVQSTSYRRITDTFTTPTP